MFYVEFLKKSLFDRLNERSSVSLDPNSLNQYHVFLASPGDVQVERQAVRKYFEEYNRHTAHLWNTRFEVIDWEHYSTIGIGRTQELINRQTLEKFKTSLALVVGIMFQRFGSPSGKSESGTEEEFNFAMQLHKTNGGWPEIKWFFRKVDQLTMPADFEEAKKSLNQWKNVEMFRKRMRDLNNPVFYTEYSNAECFAEVFASDLNLWLADPARPWVSKLSARAGTSAVPLRIEFDTVRYKTAISMRFRNLNFEMLESTGAYYGGVRLWSVFVPQSARECRQYDPQVLENLKDHRENQIASSEILPEEFVDSQRQVHRPRKEYFGQPLRSVLEVVDQALVSHSEQNRRLVILGHPGSGKSCLIRYLTLRWARVTDPSLCDTQPIPLVIDLQNYGRWECEGRKSFLRFLVEAPVWYVWQRGPLEQLFSTPGGVLLLLDGLDEIFDPQTRDAVVNDIQLLTIDFPNTAIIVTSRVVDYKAQRLRDAGFRHFMLEGLNTEQISEFITRWNAESFESRELSSLKSEQLRKVIRESSSIRMLAGNPLQLTMMTIVNLNQELPRGRVDLYNKALRVLLHAWDTEKALSDFPGLHSDVGLREKKDILRRVAYHMQAGPSGLNGNMIDERTLVGLIETYLRDELYFKQARAAARAVIDHMRKRSFVLRFVGEDSYAFVHRAFLEYFCAAEFVYRFNFTKTFTNDELLKKFDFCHHKDEWRDVLRLICGQIDECSVVRIVEHLFKRSDSEKLDTFSAVRRQALAIGYLAELRNPNRFELICYLMIRKVVEWVQLEEQCVFVDGYCGQLKTQTMLHQDTIIDIILSNATELEGRWPREVLDGIVGPDKEHLPNCRYWERMVFWSRFVAVVAGNREAVVALALDGEAGYRAGAIQALAEKWPDEISRDLIKQLAVEDNHLDVRAVARLFFEEKWPREYQAQLAIEGRPSDRTKAMQKLVSTWPDETTRAFVEKRTVLDEHPQLRSAALEILAEKWPDTTTRHFIVDRAVQERNIAPIRTALRILTLSWPDEGVRELLSEMAIQNPHPPVRHFAVKTLSEKWPSNVTRELLNQIAVMDLHDSVRKAADQALAEKWPVL